MATSLTVVKAEEIKKRTRERVVLLEMRPKDDWFVRTVTERGHTMWYLRFSITGMFPRLYGPFLSKRRAVLFLDQVIIQFLDCTGDIDDFCKKYGTRREFEFINWGPLIEHPTLSTKLARISKRSTKRVPQN